MRKEVEVKRWILMLIASTAFIIVMGGPLLAGETKYVTLDVEGMTCRLCPRAVEKSLSGVDGVEEVAVSYREKAAHVTYDVDKTTVGELIEAVERVGYDAIERSGR